MYAALQKGETSLQSAEQELSLSLLKSYELYYVSLSLIVELKKYSLNRNELLKKKHIATEADKNPSTKFVNNIVISELEVALDKLKTANKYGNLFENHPEVIANLFKLVEKSTVYNDYIASTEVNYESEKRFVVKLVDKVIAQDLQIYNFFEDNSVYWNDESEFIFSMVMKTIKEFNEELGSNNVLIPEFKDPEDKEFVYQLFRKSFFSYADNKKLIASNSKNWEVERVSLLDIIIMQSAITEVVEIAQVPVNVTLNEYIEIAKCYSSEKSGIFINGILDTIFTQLEADKKIFKQGRGLQANKL